MKYRLKPSSRAIYSLTRGGASDYSLKLTKGDIAYIMTNTTTPTSTTATSVTFAKAWGSTNYDEGISIVQTSDGGYAISGMANNYGADSYDALLIKYDPSGNLSWNKTWGGTNCDYGFSIFRFSDSGFMIVDRSDGYGVGGGDVLILKANPSGIITNCNTIMCQSPTATVTSPSATIASPRATANSLTATVTSPSATSSTIVAP